MHLINMNFGYAKINLNNQKRVNVMSIFWFNLFYLMIAWGLALSTMADVGSTTILTSTLFFLIYFCLPLTRKHKLIYQLLLSSLTIIVFFIFSTEAFNGFVLLILLIVAMHTINNLKGWQLYLQLILQYVVVIYTYILTFDVNQLSYITLLVIFISFLLFNWRRITGKYTELDKARDQIEIDYRKLKRQATLHEKNVRQEERNQIAREIHDSVGHRLTALLMQLEVARIQSEDPGLKEKFNQFKSLAQMSLDETREAVQALKSEETTGLTAVIQLIRKLEAESHLRVSFHVQSGALSFPLSNDQSVVLYRSVQEGLTNMMRHSNEKQAKVDFSIVGEQFFRFQISHTSRKKVVLQEGFGLSSMRERLEQLDGTLKINQVEGEFRLIGTFPAQNGV